mmetsp:Transcript_1959/g.4529  ORF Transcript_1959/g.4529 Transcript_1959/m.4529 type:complete len:783 (-) Transcript_1959:159-2507(-)|eukprot:CAMPEP_0178986502 /NCGR_PEP_ID=MMETSP0795-20121207/2737_1 /TAXON_ID=88552 /ORGANISM="Amoebophrya sp., Strain Ameob2" /LENGTH=782 /DNA_ID=CAMNT_0020677565 /DNA_START=29 /DNA_END=2377 /DNA_ORIENTATION=-
MAAVMVPDRIGSDQDQEARDGDDGSRVSGPSVAELEQRVGKLKEAFVGAVQKCNRAQLKAVQLQDRLDFQETQLRFLWKYVSRKVVKVESGASELGHDPAGVQILKALKESIDDMKSCIKKHEITRIAAHRQDIANGRNTFENWLRLATPSPKKRPPRGARVEAGVTNKVRAEQVGVGVRPHTTSSMHKSRWPRGQPAGKPTPIAERSRRCRPDGRTDVGGASDNEADRQDLRESEGEGGRAAAAAANKEISAPPPHANVDRRADARDRASAPGAVPPIARTRDHSAPPARDSYDSVFGLSVKREAPGGRSSNNFTSSKGGAFLPPSRSTRGSGSSPVSEIKKMPCVVGASGAPTSSPSQSPPPRMPGQIKFTSPVLAGRSSNGCTTTTTGRLPTSSLVPPGAPAAGVGVSMPSSSESTTAEEREATEQKDNLVLATPPPSKLPVPAESSVKKNLNGYLLQPGRASGASRTSGASTGRASGRVSGATTSATKAVGEHGTKIKKILSTSSASVASSGDDEQHLQSDSRTGPGAADDEIKGVGDENEPVTATNEKIARANDEGVVSCARSEKQEENKAAQECVVSEPDEPEQKDADLDATTSGKGPRRPGSTGDVSSFFDVPPPGDEGARRTSPPAPANSDTDTPAGLAEPPPRDGLDLIASAQKAIARGEESAARLSREDEDEEQFQLSSNVADDLSTSNANDINGRLSSTRTECDDGADPRAEASSSRGQVDQGEDKAQHAIANTEDEVRTTPEKPKGEKSATARTSTSGKPDSDGKQCAQQ